MRSSYGGGKHRRYEVRLYLFFTFGISLQSWADSGLLQREVRLYQELQQKHGVDITFVTYGDASDRRFESILNGISVLPVYERIRKPNLRPLALLQTALVPWIFQKEMRAADILKTNQIWGSWVAVLTKYVHRKPLLVRCGYEAYSNSRRGKKSPLVRAALFLASWFGYRHADRVWLTTKEIADFVRDEFGVHEERISVAENWIETDIFQSTFPSARQYDRILFVGRLSEEKNLPLLFSALSHLQLPCGLDIVGDGPLRLSLEQTATTLGIDVRFLGRIPNDVMPSIYQKYAVCVLCSKYEGNPKAMLEAMACGCAVLGTRVPGIRELIDSGRTGILTQEEPESLRDALFGLLSNPVLCTTLGVAARERVIKRNSFQAIVDQEAETYRSLLNRHG